MININAVNQIKQSSAAERIQLMETILQSLKDDIKAIHKNGKPKLKTFKVRKFHLGEEIHIDRDELYSQRG